MKNLLFIMLMLCTVLSCSNKMTPDVAAANAADTGVNATKDTATKPAEVAVATIPACILQKIDSIKSLPVWNPPAEIHEYLYNGRRAFALSAPCCDFFSTAVDENCNYICAPAGGFTGRGDGKCADFFKAGKHVRLVWKDERARK